MEIKVRKYEAKDKKEINQLLEESFSVQKENFQEKDFQEIVAEVGNVVCGYLLLTKVKNPILNQHYYLIDYVCVRKDYRENGIGKELMKYAEEIAKEEKTMYIQLTCSHNRVEAHQLYEKCGFIKRKSDIFRKDLL